jgi:hypothetical protein
MAISIEKTLLNNQSILEKITLVEEINEQAAEIISGGKSRNLLYAFESELEPPNPGEDPIIDPPNDPDEGGNDSEPGVEQASFAFRQDRSWRRSSRNRNRNRYC